MKKLLIAGIDPGTTLGYALLDLEGKVVKINSSKQLEMSSLIMEMIKEGRVIVIGTDKGKVPKFVEKVASKIGAKTVGPEQDLRVDDKRELTKGYEFGNEHEKDALASAIYAFKRVRALLRKVDIYLKDHHKEGLSDEVKEHMLKNGRVSITETVMMIEKPEDEMIKKRKRKRTGKTREEYFEEEIEPEKEYDETMRRLEYVKQNMQTIIKKKMGKIIRIKNQKIDMLTRKVRELEQETEKLGKNIDKLKDLVRKADKNVILKKLKNLSREELEKEELGRVIYVEEPNIFSERSAEKIRENVEIVISKKEMSKKVIDKFKVIFISASKVDAEEENGIILINKEKLEKEKNKTNILKKVIEEYRETRG